MLSNHLKTLRQRSQLNLSTLATKAGISRTTLWRWERGDVLPREEELRQVLDALTVTVPERKHAFELLRRNRTVKGTGSLLQVSTNGLRRNELLRAVRQRWAWSQSEAAERLGVNRVTLANWERGDHWPDTPALHQLCRLYQVSPEEFVALTLLPESPRTDQPASPEEVTWDDIETFTGDFSTLELRYLNARATLAQMRQDPARERELACALDYVHFLFIQGGTVEARKELRRIGDHPALRTSPELYYRYRLLFATSLKKDARNNAVAEKILRGLLDQGEAVPVDIRCRARADWAERCSHQGDFDQSLYLSAAMMTDAQANGNDHLIAISQREQTSRLIDANRFDAAARSLERIPVHTPLLSVQKRLIYAALVRQAGSLKEAVAAYGAAAQSARFAGMTQYANYFTRIASTIAG